MRSTFQSQALLRATTITAALSSSIAAADPYAITIDGSFGTPSSDPAAVMPWDKPAPISKPDDRNGLFLKYGLAPYSYHASMFADQIRFFTDDINERNDRERVGLTYRQNIAGPVYGEVGASIANVGSNTFSEKATVLSTCAGAGYSFDDYSLSLSRCYAASTGYKAVPKEFRLSNGALGFSAYRVAASFDLPEEALAKSAFIALEIASQTDSSADFGIEQDNALYIVEVGFSIPVLKR